MKMDVKYYYSKENDPSKVICCVITTRINYETLKFNNKINLNKDVIKSIIKKHGSSKEIKFTGVARLNENDVFNKKIGEKIAFNRALFKYQKKIWKITDNIKDFIKQLEMSAENNSKENKNKMIKISHDIDNILHPNTCGRAL